MPKKLIIFPFGGNGRESLLSILAINAKKKKWDVLGFVDDNKANWGKICCGIKVLGGRDVIKKIPDSKILAVPGNPHNFLERKTIIDGLGIENSRFATIIHPSAVISPDSEIGYNVTIMANCFVGCNVKIGNHSVFLPNTVISHDSKIGDYCCVGSNTSISGYVTIGPGTYVGSGTNVRNNISIGARCLVGLGANIISDFKDGVVIAGNPAKTIEKVAK